MALVYALVRTVFYGGPLTNAIRTFPIEELIDGCSDKVPEVPQVLVYHLKQPELGWRSRPEHGRFPQARVQDGQRSAEPEWTKAA